MAEEYSIACIRKEDEVRASYIKVLTLLNFKFRIDNRLPHAHFSLLWSNNVIFEIEKPYSAFLPLIHKLYLRIWKLT